MKFSIISLLTAALMVAGVTACAESGQVCQNSGAKSCGCGTGKLFQCEQNGSNLKWKDLGNCPSNPGGLQCVNGACVK